MSEVFCTRDYDMFKLIDENREIRPGHVDALCQSLKKQNLLELDPILVNENYEVIDGQHRLSAAKILQIPLYYKITKEDNSILVLLNSHQKSWKIDDFVRYWQKQGKPLYTHISILMKKKEGVNSIGLLLSLIAPNFNKDRFNELKEGKLEYDPELAERLVDQWKDVYLALLETGSNQSFLKSRFMLRAFNKFASAEGYDHERFLNKIRFGEPIRRLAGTKEILEVFAKIYNKHVRKGSNKYCVVSIRPSGMTEVKF